MNTKTGQFVAIKEMLITDVEFVEEELPKIMVRDAVDITSLTQSSIHARGTAPMMLLNLARRAKFNCYGSLTTRT